MWSQSAPVRYWACREMAQRWRAIVVLGLLGGLAGGVAFAALAGARRTETVYDRWRVATLAPDAIVFPTQVGVFPADFTRCGPCPRSWPPVSSSSPTWDRRSCRTRSLPGDDQLYRTVARPLLTEGRLPDPARADEVLVNPRLRGPASASATS